MTKAEGATVALAPKWQPRIFFVLHFLCLFLVSYIGILPVNQLQDLPLQDQIEYPYQISQVLTSVNISGSTGFH